MTDKNNIYNEEYLSGKSLDFPELPHIEGLQASSLSAGLYNDINRDDLMLFTLPQNSIFSAVYTKSKVCSECIKWNNNQKIKNIRALFVNTKNANTLTGKQGYSSINELADELSKKLKFKKNELLFSSTGVIGEKFPLDKIKNKIQELTENLGSMNKLKWIKSARAIMTTDTIPKMTYSQFKINKQICSISGIAKGSGMVFPNMGTMLGFIFTDIKISQKLLGKALKENLYSTFNAISVDGDTSTNDMVIVFSTQKGKNKIINKINSKEFIDFKKNLHEVMLNLSKQIVMDGEGAKKFIEINVSKAKNENSAKKIAFTIANSQLVKTAIAGEDPNWGRILMAAGKSGENIKVNKINLKIGNFIIFSNGIINKNYKEEDVKKYMKNKFLNIEISIGTGNKTFKAYTCDLTHDYISINADYRN